MLQGDGTVINSQLHLFLNCQATIEQVEAGSTDRNPDAVVLNAIDPRFDRQMLDMMQELTPGQPIFVASMSRISRNLAELMRGIEILLSRQAIIVTTNYMLRSTDGWIRRDHIVKPETHKSFAGMSDMRGLSGAHAKAVQRLRDQFDPRSPT